MASAVARQAMSQGVVMSKTEIPSVSADADVMRERATLERVKGELSKARVLYEDATQAAMAARNDFDSKINAILNGRDAPGGVSAVERQELADRVRILAAAVEKQRRNVTDAERQASARISEQLKPDYVAILKRGAKAIAAFRAFIVDEGKFREAMDDAGVNFATTIRPMGFPRIDESDCDAWDAEAKQYYDIGA